MNEKHDKNTHTNNVEDKKKLKTQHVQHIKNQTVLKFTRKLCARVKCETQLIY